MIKNVGFWILILFVAALTVGCDKSNISSSDYMTLDEIQYVNEYPEVYPLSGAIEVDPGVIGIMNFCIYDSLLILSTADAEGLWSFVSVSKYNFLGKFLSKGNGPYEFFQSPSVVRNLKFINENGSAFVDIYDQQTGKLYEMNINKSIKNNQLEVRTIKNTLPPFLFNFSIIDSTTFYCKEINDIETQQLRYIISNDEKIIPPHVDKLNRASVKKGEDFNILSTITKLDYDKKLIIEMPISLNYINIYSLDGSFGKTICIGNELDNIKKIQEKKRDDRMYTFSDLRLFSDFWGVIFINEDLKTFQAERKKHSAILLFDWEGKPLAKLQLDTFITSFDIDIINGYLYTLDIQSDTFQKYDIQNILDKL